MLWKKIAEDFGTDSDEYTINYYIAQYTYASMLASMVASMLTSMLANMLANYSMLVCVNAVLGERHDTFKSDGWCNETRVHQGTNGAWGAFWKQTMLKYWHPLGTRDLRVHSPKL